MDNIDYGFDLTKIPSNITRNPNNTINLDLLIPLDKDLNINIKYYNYN